jgi:RpiR family transcriptional regulator, carbohydrate utilization regulator
MAPSSGVILKIQGLAGSMLPAERKVAEYIINHERDVIHQSITELAERCGTSEATVIRFCRKLNFKGFQDFKITIAQAMVSPLESIHEDIEEDDDDLAIARKIYKASIQAIEDSLSVVDSEQLQRAANAMVNARRILFLGVGGSGVVAKDAEHKFLKTGIPVVAYSDIFMQTMSAALVEPGDVVVGISHTGSTKSIVQAMKMAREAGATTICITQFIKSPITKVSDIKLFVVSKEVDYRSEATGSRIAQLCLLDTLYVSVAKQRKVKSIEVIQKTRAAIASEKF